MGKGGNGGKHIYHWKHGWIPLTHAAALKKAHGSEAGAAKIMGKRIRSAPAAQIRSLSDDALAEHLAEVGDDEKAIGRILGELDRRDREQERKAARRKAREDAQEAEYDRLVDGGEDPESAYAKAYGVSEEKQRRQEVISSLRASGYRGSGLDALVRDAYSEHARQAYLDAEAETNGYLIAHKWAASSSGPKNPAVLFTGPDATARKYASDELLAYWEKNGRLTFEDFKASLLGGQLGPRGTYA